jgi:hypothetical protein
VAGTSGTANTGGGAGGAGGGTNVAGGNGGSGVVVLKFNSALRVAVGSGLTSSSTPSGADTILTITAGTDTVTFS